MGCFHDKQRACRDYANNLGNGLRLCPQRSSCCLWVSNKKDCLVLSSLSLLYYNVFLQRSGQQSNGISVESGGRRDNQKKDGRHAYVLYVLLCLPEQRSADPYGKWRQYVRSLGRRERSATSEFSRTLRRCHVDRPRTERNRQYLRLR